MSAAPREIKKMTDEQLLEAIAGSDNLAFRELFDRFYKILLGTAVNLLKAEDSGKDVVQDVFLQVWKNREKIEITSSVLNYFKRAVINKSLNHIKRNRRFEDEDLLVKVEDGNLNPEANLENVDLKEIIQKALLKVPEKSRLIFILKRQEGLSLKEIADKLNISPKTVENQITVALKILKEALRPYYKEFNNSS